jgi:threonine synthase
VVCLSTAHPAKFTEAVTKATGIHNLPLPPALSGLSEMPEFKVEMDTDEKAAGKLREMIIKYY